MNTYIVTWFSETCDEYLTDQIEAEDIVEACYSTGCDLKNIISVMRIYEGND